MKLISVHAFGDAAASDIIQDGIKSRFPENVP